MFLKSFIYKFVNILKCLITRSIIRASTTAKKYQDKTANTEFKTVVPALPPE